MKYFLFCIFLFITISHIRAQQIILGPNGDTVSFIQPPSLGDSLKGIGDLKGALIEYRKQYSHDKRVSYNFACAFSIDRQIDSAYKYLFESTKFDKSVAPLTDPSLLPLRSDKRWIEYEDGLVDNLIVIHPNAITDIPLAKKLWEMMALDQKYYYEINIIQKTIGMSSPVLSALWDEKEKINSKNAIELDSIINIKGWPKFSQVGHFASTGAFLIVQHSDIYRQKKYLPIIKKLCDENEADLGDYALMYDRVQVLQNKPQLYGSQVKYNDNLKQYELYPIEDEKRVNKRREEMGLSPLEVYLSNWNIIYMPKNKK